MIWIVNAITQFPIVILVTGNFFSVLDVPPAKGRNFLTEEDEVPGRNPVCVISYGLWQRSFAGDPNIVGRLLTLNGVSSVVTRMLRIPPSAAA